MDIVNPAVPADIVARLSTPSAAYRRSARLAVLGLLVFVAAYFGLAGWFLWTAYHLTVGQGSGATHPLLAYFIGLCALFLGGVMIAALFAVKRSPPEGLHEITPEQEPGLFIFLHELADAAGAPRPHKVFLSDRVNAAVFYDLSLLNLIFPSRKNLEIGLALVNVLNRGELRAVLAHEFGHFAQRSMAVGRWVYVAQQIAGQLVSRRNGIDDFLARVRGFDLRLMVPAAVVQVVLWSVRSLVDSAFGAVILMQRALSREMELHADLVAVSLTGSDALVHALHRLQSADDAWARTLRFAHAENSDGRPVRDIFALQSAMTERVGAILNDDAYGRVPAPPRNDPAKHRLFKVELAQPPRMWLTHPLNHEREANAKRLYVAAPIDPRPAWSLFHDPARLRLDISARVMAAEQAAADEALTLAALDRMFGHEHFDPRYRGVYFGRPLTRHVDRHQRLRDPARPSLPSEHALLYPPSLRRDIERLRGLDEEAAQLKALIDGRMKAPGGVVKLRGEEIKKRELPGALARVGDEIERLTAQLRAHDFLCRSWHQRGAALLGNGWCAYLDGLLALLHYAEHTEANLRDAQALVRNTVQVATALPRATDEAVTAVIMAANDLHYVMEQVYRERGAVLPDDGVARRMQLTAGWAELLGEFKLGLCQREHINPWLRAVDGWVDHVAGCLSSLRNAALGQLLVSEAAIAAHLQARSDAAPAPAPSQAPSGYPTLLVGAGRALQTRLGWWARFQRADGWLPGAARLLAAGAIVGVVLGLGSFSDHDSVTMYNALAVPLTVTLDGEAVALAAHGIARVNAGGGRHHHLETRGADGGLVEAFDADSDGAMSNMVYNVAGASPLVEWSAVYGGGARPPPRQLGAPRWLASGADFLFAQPPRSISSKSGGGIRTVLEGLAGVPAAQQLGLLKDDAERARVLALHARWDRTADPQTADWLEAGAGQPGLAEVLAKRVEQSPNDVLLLRAEFDASGPGQQGVLCRRAAQRSLRAPADGDLKYMALRCLPDGAETDQLWRAARAQWPRNGWIAYALAYQRQHSDEWDVAATDLSQARALLPHLRDRAGLELARIRRFQGQPVDDLVASSDSLRQSLAPESAAGGESKGEPEGEPEHNAYAHLAGGRLEQALSVGATSPAFTARLVRLAAASDGASPAIVARMLALSPTQGVDFATVWTSMAVAMRGGGDGEAYVEPSYRIYGKYQPLILAFLKQLQGGANPLQAERMVKALPPAVRGEALSAAVVLLQDKAPAAWRAASRRLLFVGEHPYFG